MSKRLLESNPLHWFYGSASIAFGIKNYAFSYLLLVFATRVLEIPAASAAMAIGIAVLWDAVSDLVLGHWSDKTKSRLGRRHPFMYASLFIFPISFWLIFNPPFEITESNGFWFLLVLAIVIRTGTTLVEVPSVAQLPELEADYDRRSRWLALRQTLGWYGGNGIHLLNFIFWVGIYGLDSHTGYKIFSTVGAVAIALTIVISSLGTQRYAMTLPQPSESFRMSEIVREFQQMLQSLRNRNFAVLFGYGLISGIAGGLSTALYIYNTTFFFGFNEVQIGITAIAVLIAPIIAYIVGPMLGKRFEKKRAAIYTTLTYITLFPIPYVLLLAGYWPPLGSVESLAIYTTFIVVEVTCIIIGAMMMDSMMADVVEDSEISTARRSEGLFFATRAFGSKAISAGGILSAGLILSFVGMDTIATAADMTMSHRVNLAALFLPLWCGLNLAAIVLVWLYRIGRRDHSINLEQLALRKQKSAISD